MKNNIVLITLLVGAGYFDLLAQSKIVESTFKVSGNCVMCKRRIETALDHSGIKMAQWDPKTKNLEVVYNSNKISEQKIHELISGIGHDTDKIKSVDSVYAALPFCCLYRDHDHSNIKDGDHLKDHK